MHKRDPAGSRFDYLAAVFFGPAFEVLGVVRVTYDAVMELDSQTRSTFRF